MLKPNSSQSIVVLKWEMVYLENFYNTFTTNSSNMLFFVITGEQKSNFSGRLKLKLAPRICCKNVIKLVIKILIQTNII